MFGSIFVIARLCYSKIDLMADYFALARDLAEVFSEQAVCFEDFDFQGYYYKDYWADYHSQRSTCQKYQYQLWCFRSFHFSGMLLGLFESGQLRFEPFV